MLLCFWLSLSTVAILIFSGKLRTAIATAPVLSVTPESIAAIGPKPPTLSVIIPAYNEAVNIAACVESVLDSTTLPADVLDVWVVDDQSSDDTLAIAQHLQKTRQDDRLHLLAGQPRPQGETWMGKNWACVQAMEQAKGEYVLFIDCDVTLKPGSLETTLAFVDREQIDLCTAWITIACGCWGEWLAQPVICSLLAVGYDFAEVNDPHSETVFGVGPFMFFRRSAYEAIGGHRGVADIVLEDVELSRRIKQHSLKLWYGLGHDLGQARMYQSLGQLWEGWTKNWHLGGGRNVTTSLKTAFYTFLIFAMPGLGWIAALLQGIVSGFEGWTIAAIALGLTAIGLHYLVRRSSQRLSNIPLRYWWLSTLGGLIVGSIAIVSIVKVETGWGWTWRGRQLSVAIDSPLDPQFKPE